MSQPGARFALGLVGPVPPPDGGMAVQTAQMRCFLAQEGMDVRLLPVNPPYRPPWVERIRGLRALFRLVPYAIRMWKMTGEVQLLHVMANSGWSWHLFAAPAVWIGVLRGVPVLLNYRGGMAGDFLRRQARWVLPTLRRAARIVVPSPFLRDIFQAYGISAEVIPNAVDLRRFHPSISGSGGGTDAPHLIVARHLEAIYDVATAIRAFHRLRAACPHARLTIAGSGPEREALQDLTHALGLDGAVRFTGNLDRDAMAALYRGADLMLNASLEDNMPNSLLEAMASGVPIVSTDAGGIRLMIRHERNGILIAKGDAESMARSALRVLRDARLRDGLVQAGLADVQRYAWDQVKLSWLENYRSLLKEA